MKTSIQQNILSSTLIAIFVISINSVYGQSGFEERAEQGFENYAENQERIDEIETELYLLYDKMTYEWINDELTDQEIDDELEPVEIIAQQDLIKMLKEKGYNYNGKVADREQISEEEYYSDLDNKVENFFK